jgi:hypothetical protein
VGSTVYEPAGDGTTDGTNLPNYKNFCMSKCHARTNVYSSERGENLAQIYWGTSGDYHGKNSGEGGMGYQTAPYTKTKKNYVLNCSDCHEPHGSGNEWLLRTTVNGKDNITVPAAGDWWEFCTACHVLTNGTSMYHRQGGYPACPTCHFHGQFL